MWKLFSNCIPLALLLLPASVAGQCNISAIPNDPAIWKRPHPAAAPQALPAAGVNVRISVDPAEEPAVRAAVLASPGARIAEPAQYEVASRRDYPLTLRLVNLWEPQSAWFLHDDD